SAPARQIIEELAARDRNGEVLTAVRHIPARVARFAAMPSWVRPELAAAYAAKGVTQLFTHQAQAAELTHAGRNVVVVTPTASGKTLCYNLPILNSILENSDTRALYLYPTKALAQDQLAELHDLCGRLDDRFGVFTYDGDTPGDARRAIRQQGHIVITNPDMLHTGILPHHTKWTRLFENLKYIVLDELHTYRGVFGSHLCNVLRRLQRIANFYGSDPQFICSSATIANPGDLASRLIENSVEVVDDNGAPAAEKFFAFYNPPVVNRFLGIRRSYVNETSRLAQEFLSRGQQTIVFSNSRIQTEVLLTYLKAANPQPPGQPETIRGYRGGYLPNERREIERGLRDGRIRGVVATNALELGIDIGSLDVTVMAGYPGTIASTWQRAGRAGRRSGSSCAVMVASSAPLDQFIVQHPDYFFGNSPERAFIQPDNLEILVNHLKCAAFELPIAPQEKFGTVDVPELCARLAEAGYLHSSGGNWHWTQEAYPADAISLRAVTSDNFVIIDETSTETHSPRGRLLPACRNHGDVQVRSQIVGFKKIKFFTNENVGAGKLELPENEMHTTSFWLTLERPLVASLPFSVAERQNGMFGLLHALETVASLLLMCDRRDIRTAIGERPPSPGVAPEIEAAAEPVEEVTSEKEFYEPNLYLYDAYPGGIGFSEPLFRAHETLLAKTRELISACPCEKGCPSCVGPAGDRGEQGKEAALAILARLCE
ncbi:MAG: DEAD/DEAH box helicase, partial [Acidobacteria bacterium]|nr:DEAD/DEAH box helicase [Acidobacteriota bacterium]